MAGPITAVGPARVTSGAPAAVAKPPPERSFGEVLGEAAGPRAPDPGPPAAAPVGPARAGPASTRDGPPQLRRVLVDLVEGERRMDGVIRAALSGRDFTTQELIAIQATVLRHSQQVEAVSRLLDRLTGAVKTTLQTQV
jgi:hypothetical protein